MAEEEKKRLIDRFVERVEFSLNSYIMFAKSSYFKLMGIYLAYGGLTWLVLMVIYLAKGNGPLALISFGVWHLHMINTELYYKLKSWELFGVPDHKEERTIQSNE